MSAAVFTQYNSSQLYLSADSESPRPFGFLAVTLSTPTASLPEIWSSDPAGIFFSLSAPLGAGVAWPAVENALRAWLTGAGWPEARQRMLWVELGGADGATPLRVLPLRAAQAGTASSLIQSVTLDFNGYLLSLPKGATIGPSPGGDALLITGASIFSRTGSPPASYPMVRQALSIVGDGPLAGGLSFAIDLSHDGSGGAPSDFERLDIGMRYGWSTGGVGVDYYHVPTIRQAPGTTRLWAMLVPFESLAAPVSRISFLPPAATPRLAPPVLTSSFVTPQGRLIALTPLAAQSAAARPGGLVFGRQPLFAPDQSDAPFTRYLTLDGDFSFAPADGTVPKAGLRMVCGLGVMEHVSGADATLVSFAPGPAFMPGAGQTLTSLATTAWVMPGGTGGSAAYYGQPEAAPFYGEPATAEAADPVQFLDLVDVPSAVLPASLSLLPMLGHAGLGTDTAAAVAVEAQILAPARAAAVAKAPDAKPPSPLPPFGLTPQGLIVGFDQNSLGDWAWMGVGNVAGTTRPDIVFQDVKPAFQQAMQNAAPFVVLADPQLVLANSSAGAMQADIEDWAFDLSPSSWTPASGVAAEDSGPRPPGVMIIKMDRTTALQDWIDQLGSSSWPDAAKLPGQDLDATADLLRRSVAVAQARRAASADPATSPYAHFLDVMLIEPTWTGTVMLNAAIVSIPTDLEAIQAGIDPKLFYAHHIGFQTGLVGLSKTGLALQPDRIFGAIDYEDTADLVLDPQSSEDFQFKALQVTVGFERSRVTTFTGRVELFINRLYSATVRKYPTANGNNLILDGVKVIEAGDDGTLRTGYRFGSSTENDYQLAGSALQTVAITETSLALNSGLSVKPVLVSDFIMAGGLMFQPVSGFDMFSFGPEPTTPAPSAPAALAARDELEWIETPFGLAQTIATIPKDAERKSLPIADDDDDGAGDDNDGPRSALLFTNFMVRMTYDTGAGTVTFQVLNADTAFNMGGSTPRQNGLAGRFPAKPLRFVKSDGSGQAPKDLGYDPVSCGVQQGLIAEPWYGIEYEMELGTLGALANSVGITLTILAAWGVDETAETPPVFLGISLPGMGLSGFELALQGILKIGFSTLQFDTYPTEDGGLGYIMRLRDFGLHVLGVDFPSGHISVLIAGAPEAGAPEAGAPSKLGWFAGYQEADYKPVSRATIRRRSAGPRRALPAGSGTVRSDRYGL